MSGPGSTLAYRVFHGLLVLVLLVDGFRELWHALPELADPTHAHLAMVGALQTAGAVLLLFPATVRWGGLALLLVLLPSYVFEAMHGDHEPHLLVYAAGVWLVMTRGAAWRRPTS